MHHWRLAQIIAVLAVVIGSAALWTVGQRDGAQSAAEPIYGRYVIAPGADPSTLPLSADGAHLIEVDRTGALLVHTGERVRRQPKPRAFQEIDGRRRNVSVHFDITAAGDPRLVVGPYDRTSPLVIEPEENELRP